MKKILTIIIGLAMLLCPFFVFGAVEKLIGVDDLVIVDGSLPPNNLVLNYFQAVNTGILTQIRLKVDAWVWGDVKIGIYTDSAVGEPTFLITANNIPQSIDNSSGEVKWITLNISPTPIVKDTYYWLGINANRFVIGADFDAGTQQAWDFNFSNDMPNMIEFGYPHSFTALMSGWGEIGVPPPAGIIPFTADMTAGILTYSGDLFTDMKWLISLIVGLPVSFWVIRRVIGLVRV